MTDEPAGMHAARTFAAVHAATTAARIPARRPQAPSGFEPGVRYEAGLPAEVVVQLDTGATVVPDDEQAWRDDITRTTGLVIPDRRRVEVAQVRYWGSSDAPQVYVRFTITDREAERTAVDYLDLVKTARASRTPKPRKAAGGRTRVVVVADAQLHKLDHRGGWDEFVARSESMLANLEDEMRAVRADDVVILDPGDLTEGFENTAQQAHTNTGSHPTMLLDAQRFLTRWVTRIADRVPGDTRVATVPSNHGAWRRGKDKLGKPRDDYGIMVHRAVAEAFELAKRGDVSWVIPGEWDTSLALQVRGAVVGLAHGDDAGANPNAVTGWWAKQTHGGMPLAGATILVTGHWHHLRIEPSGQIDGRDRWWFQAPTMDNGSSWWANGAGGSDSEPGVLTFTVDDEGRWDNLRIIRADAPAGEATA